jgi:cobalt-precorrin 5A hydrolase
MIVAGIGCRLGTPAEEIERAIERALIAFGLASAQVNLIATAAEKAEEPGLVEAARRLAVGVVVCATGEMSAVAEHALTRSPRVAALKGVPSVAETAALAAAGRNGRLLGPRVAFEGATCAIAVGEGR